MKVTSITTDNIESAKDLIIKELISNDIQYVDMGDELLIETDLLIRFKIFKNQNNTVLLLDSNYINDISMIFKIAKLQNNNNLLLDSNYINDLLEKSVVQSIDLKDKYYEQFIDKKTKRDFKLESKKVKNKTKEYKRRIMYDKGRY